MNILKEIENILCTLAIYLPPILIAIVPFRDKLRFSKKVISVLIVLLCAFEIALLYLNIYSGVPNRIILPIRLLMCSIFAISAINAHVGKIMFTLIILSNMTNCITVISKWVEKMIFGIEAATIPLEYTALASTLIVAALAITPVYMYFNSVYRKGISKEVKGGAWNYLWIIPATFYITWLHHLEDGDGGILNIAFDTRHVLFFLFLNASAFFAYHTVIRMIDAQSKNLELERSNHSLTLQTLQHENLKERIEEARRAKHDVRHHITYLDSCLQKGEYEKAKEYLKSYKKSLPDDSTIAFCEHNVINSLLLYYAQLSKNESVDFDVVAMDVPKAINLPDEVFSVVLGNLLENALDACCEQTEGDRTIVIKCKADKSSFFFRIENTYNAKTIRKHDEVFLSSKAHGSGLGLESIKKIVERYEGIFEPEEADGRFVVCVFLNVPQ